MSNEHVKLVHAQALEQLSNHLGITLDQYFFLIKHDKFGYEFSQLITGAINANMTLVNYWKLLKNQSNNTSIKLAELDIVDL